MTENITKESKSSILSNKIKKGRKRGYMPNVNFFAVAEEKVNQVRPEITEIFGPAHIVITKLIRKQRYNIVFQLPADQITIVTEAEKAHPYRENINQKRIWGLKLRIDPSVDEEGDKTWVKKSNIWYRMLDIAGDQAEIGYKEPYEPDEFLFRSISKGQLPYPHDWFEGMEVLLCAIGLRDQQVLQEAVIAEREFNPKHWNSDGYYIGPSKSDD